MMYCVKPGVFSGRFKAPPSKPMSQRYLLAAALAEGATTIRGVEWSDDFTAMYRAVQPLARLVVRGDEVAAERREPDYARAFNVMESGFTLRTAVAVYAGVPGHTAVYYTGTLRGRPVEDLLEVLKKLARVEHGPGVVLIEGRRIDGFEVEVRADVSSQYISGLMYLASMSRGAVRPLGARKSWHFVEATAEVLGRFGARIRLGEVVEVEGPLKSPGVLQVPGDYSLAAFLAVAALATGGSVEIWGPASAVDREVLEIFEKMGARVQYFENGARIGGALSRGVDVDLGNNPDLAMPVALAAAFVEDVTTIRGVEHLAYKESNRIAAVLDVLKRLGAYAEYSNGAIVVRGPPANRDVKFVSHNDHRIVLMALAASRAVGGCVDDISPVAKSWPAAPLYFKQF